MQTASEESLIEAFSRLRPVCVRLTENVTTEKIDALSNAIDSVDPLALSDLQEYVLFPLRIILKKTREFQSEKISLQTTICLTKVIGHVDSICQWPIFVDLFNGLCWQISSQSADISVASVCEELKLETVQCLTLLLRKLSSILFRKLYSLANLAMLGHAVTLLLSLAQNEMLRRLKIATVKCLMELMSVEKREDNELRTMSGNVFASFLPGIAVGLSKVITGDVKQGHEVTCTAIRGWSLAVTLVFGDECLAMVKTSADDQKTPPGMEDLRNLRVTRSGEWIKSTAEKLKILVARMVQVANHSHWRVRLALAKLANDLLEKCISSLQSCVVLLLDVLVRGTSDEYSDVANYSSSALASFQEKQMANGSRSLIDILEENIFCLATQLPCNFMDPNDVNKLSSIQLLCGYLRIIGDRTDVLLTSDVHLKRLSLALMQVLEFEYSSVMMIEEQSSEIPLNRCDSGPRQRYQFKHFSDLKVESELVRVCQLLGQYGSLSILVDHFMELFNQSAHYRKQATFCISEILSGSLLAKRTSDCCAESEEESLIRSIIDEYLQPEHWNLPLVGGHVKDSSINSFQVEHLKFTGSFNDLTSNVLQTCLLLDSVGRCARLLGTRFEVFQIEVLYPVLEKVGCDNRHVSEHAFLCLCEIAEACGCQNVAGLIRSGMDYLLNSVTLKWRRLRQNPQVLDVLRVMFQYSDEDILPLLNNTIYEMFDVLDLHHSEFGAQFMRVFQALVSSISRWFGPSKNAEDIKPPVNLKSTNLHKHKTAEDVLSFFKEYHHQKQILEDMEKDDDDLENIENDDDDLENMVPNMNLDDATEEVDDDITKPKEPPHHIKLLKEILERCQHLLVAPDGFVRLLILDIIGQSCILLKSYQDDLLPLVHKVWKPFVQRFSDPEQYVVKRAMDTLCQMSVSAEDFLRRRVTEDIFPRIVSSLNGLSNVSLKAGPAYRHTASCKLQLCILKNLGNLCQHVDVRGQQVTSLLHICLPYLSARQPQCLQDACMEMFKHFVAIDPDNVWLLLNDVYCPSVLLPPADSLPSIKMAGISQRNEYTDNVTTLLSCFE